MSACCDVEPGSIQVDEVQQANLRLCAGEVYKFSVFQLDSSAADAKDAAASSDEDEDQQPACKKTQEAAAAAAASAGSGTHAEADVGGDIADAAAAADIAFELTDLDCEVRLLHGKQQQQQAVQYVVVELPGVPPLLLRVTAANTLTAEEQQDKLGYHCFRGLLTPDTAVYMMTAMNQQQQQQQQQPDLADTAAVLNTQQQLSQLSLADSNPSSQAQQQQQQQQDAAAGTLQAPPVQSRVAAAAGGVQLLNAVNTLTFDRVLIFLEAQALKRQLPGFAMHYLDDLQQAGEQLGLRSLQEYCAHLKGTRQAALGVYSFADVQRANASGKVWLLLDGMVLDVAAGCRSILEMYHASRESFLYIAEFYIGELVPEDLAHVPLGGKQPPSADFLVQLREYTAFRQPMLAEAAQRMPVTHLGAGKARAAGGQ
ncbi:hypothetical protein COO60DRAFT_1633845 [Scenedesmus sp. NREL 46B-D3]|nr:hypothetical protein COO60DRAFT_1633845 [Scenedesmus sp. NREL 46B-D3]